MTSACANKMGLALVPIINRQGLLVLAGSWGICLVAALVWGLPLPLSIIMLAATSVLFGKLMLDEYRQARRILDALEIAGTAPDRLSTAAPASLVLRCLGRYCPLPLILDLRLPHPAGLHCQSDEARLELSPEKTFAEAHFVFTPLQRGPLRWEDVYLRVAWPGGFFVWQELLRLDNSIESLVYPNSNALRDWGSVSQSRMISGAPRDHSGGEGREFDSLRHYAVGDDLRRVDWKRSARGVGLLVRQYRPESHQRVLVALDCGRRMGNRLGDRLQLDYAVDAAATLARSAQRQDDEFGVFAFDYRVITQLAPRRGVAQHSRAMTELMKLAPSELEADYQILTQWARLSTRRSLLVLLTSVSSPAGFDAIRSCLEPLRTKHLPLVLALADRDMQALAGQAAENLEQAYIVAAAREQTQVIQARTQMLQHAGIDCLYTDARSLAGELLHKYMRLKLSGRL